MYYSFSKQFPFPVPVIESEVTLYSAAFMPPHNGIKVSAVWDTGATKTFISQRVGDRLGIVPLEMQKVGGLLGDQMAGLALLAMRLPNNLLIPDKRVLIVESRTSIDMLIGMDIIQCGDLHISNTNGQTLFSFVIPSLPVPINLQAEAQKYN